MEAKKESFVLLQFILQLPLRWLSFLVRYLLNQTDSRLVTLLARLFSLLSAFLFQPALC